jgi:hypothetical protein
MEQKRKIWLILLLAFFLSGTAAFALTRIKTRERRKLSPPVAVSAEVLRPASILGKILGVELPPVEKIKSATETAKLTAPLPEAVVKETEKVIRETVNTVTETIKESVLNNVTIDQEKIVEEVTAKILKSLLSQAGTTAVPVDKAVYDACLAVVQKAGIGSSGP